MTHTKLPNGWTKEIARALRIGDDCLTNRHNVPDDAWDDYCKGLEIRQAAMRQDARESLAVDLAKELVRRGDVPNGFLATEVWKIVDGILPKTPTD